MASRFCSGDESGVFKGQAGAYASLYKAYGETVDERTADDITVSIVRD